MFFFEERFIGLWPSLLAVLMEVLWWLFVKKVYTSCKSGSDITDSCLLVHRKSKTACLLVSAVSLLILLVNSKLHVIRAAVLFLFVILTLRLRLNSNTFSICGYDKVKIIRIFVKNNWKDVCGACLTPLPTHAHACTHKHIHTHREEQSMTQLSKDIRIL